jgi:hypothetical protein
MIEALEASGQEAPLYLRAVALENDPHGLKTAAFAMHCFWVGEMELGKVPGVVATEAGWIEGREVTRVTYDPSTITTPALQEAAEEVECADKTYTPNDDGGIEGYRAAKESDQKRQIKHWVALQNVPHLTTMQLTKLNAFATVDMDAALAWLSPRQRRALDQK